MKLRFTLLCLLAFILCQTPAIALDESSRLMQEYMVRRAEWLELRQSALGKIKDTSSVLPIMKWKKDKREAARYMVAKALDTIADARYIPTLLDFLDDDYMTVRLAAQ